MSLCYLCLSFSITTTAILFVFLSTLITLSLTPHFTLSFFLSLSLGSRLLTTSPISPPHTHNGWVRGLLHSASVWCPWLSIEGSTWPALISLGKFQGCSGRSCPQPGLFPEPPSPYLPPSLGHADPSCERESHTSPSCDGGSHTGHAAD